ncbi:MAG TPA: hypothetical protein VFQ45_09790 [Longimicrobium sp.]|nr:hypothetical protein [Longimicrobium sp.]
MRLVRIAPAAVLLACAAAPAAAQPAAPCAVPADSAAAAGDTAAARPDVLVRASVRAREVRFAGEPRASVRIGGCAPGDSLRVLERRNLPERVEPGVTYRDVYVAVELRAYLDVRCLLALAAAAPNQPGAPAPDPCAPLTLRTPAPSAPPRGP